MKVLILGGTGFIGSPLLEQLSKKNWKVGVLHRGRTPLAGSDNIREVLCDQRESLTEQAANLRAFAPDWVVDLIGYTAQDAWNRIQAFAGMDTRWLLISSGDVYRSYGVFKDGGSPLVGSDDERAPLRRRLFPYRQADAPYDELVFNYDKILVERLLQSQTDWRTVILRLPAVFGPGDRQRRFQDYLDAMRRGVARIPIDRQRAPWRWSHTQVSNVAAAIIRILEAQPAEEGIYNLAEREAPSEVEIAQYLAEQVDWAGAFQLVERQALPAPQRLPGNFDQDLVLDGAKFRERFNFTFPVPIWQGLARMAEV